MKIFLITLSVLIFSLAYLTAQETVYPTDDITVNEGSSTMSPADDQLWIANWSPMQNYQQTLIKFDLSSYSGQTISGATLKLNQYYHAPDGSPTPSKIYAITETWDESSWSATTNISHGATEYATPEFTSTLGWYEIDITSLVNEWLQGTTVNYGLVLIADSNTKFAQFYSKDAADESNRPRIELDLSNGINEIAGDINLDVYPNPATDHFNIELNIEKQGKLEIKIVDILGNQVKTVSVNNIAPGFIKKSIRCDNLNKGVYFIQIRINDDVYIKKLAIE